MSFLFLALIFLTHPTDPPCAYVAPDGAIVGTDVDLARKIAAEMGEELKVEGVDFETIIPRLKEGTADFGIATITITEARRRDVDFSMPYEIGGACFMYRTDSPRPRMSQLASLRIGVENGTTDDLYLCNHGCDPVRFVNMADAVGALEKGQVDAIFFDCTPLRTWAKASNGKFSVTPLETRDRYGVAVSRKRPDVLAAANRVIEKEVAK